MTESASNFGFAYILMFALMYILNYAKELFWGSIRNLKVIFSLTLIRFPQTPTMTTFMSGMSNFSQMDVYNGE